MNDRVKIRTENDIAYVTLTRTDKHNGMDLPMLKEVIAAQKTVRKMKGIRAVILHGEGPSFCAGLDIKSVMGEPLKAFASYLQLWWPMRNDFQTWSMGWRELPVPVIAVVHGNAFGAGLQLALGADIRICTPDAQLSMMEAKWGLVPDMGGVALMRELMRIDLAKELTLTGRVMTGIQAHELGLVTHVCKDPMARAQELIGEISTRSPDSVGAGKFLLQEAWRAIDGAALRAERLWQRRVITTKNQRISVQRNQKKEDIPFSERKI
ncbi:Enoyl-CoA hydratase/isomerase family protein [gamma proteobacterium HdN1]|nr:Enoyl-CoA hydratase/isomerase family protein [gamma proteobacterium HdN1]